VLSGGDTGYRLAEVDEVQGCLVVQTFEHHEAELERDPQAAVSYFGTDKLLRKFISKLGWLKLNVIKSRIQISHFITRRRRSGF